MRQFSRFVGFCRPVEAICAATAQVKISASAAEALYPGRREPHGPANVKAAVIKGAGNVFLTVTAAFIAYQGDTGLFIV